MKKPNGILAFVARVWRIFGKWLLPWVCLVALYLAFGFIALPLTLQNTLPGLVSGQTKSQLSIASTAFDPLTWTLEFKNFELIEPSGERLLGADRLVLDIALLESIRARHIVLNKLELSAPSFVFRKYKPTGNNFEEAFIEPNQAPSPKPPTTKLSIDVATLIVVNGQGQINLTNSYSVTVRDLSLTAEHISNHANSPANFNISLSADHLGTLSGTGSLSLQPDILLDSQIAIRDCQLPWLWNALDLGETTNIQLTRGLTDTAANLVWFSGRDKSKLAIQKGSLSLKNVFIQDIPSAGSHVSVDQVSSNGIQLEWPSGELRIPKIELRNVHVAQPSDPKSTENPDKTAKFKFASITNLRRKFDTFNTEFDSVDLDDGEFGLSYNKLGLHSVLIPKKSPSVKRPPQKSSGTESFQIKNFNIDHSTLRWRDESQDRPILLRFTPLRVNVRDISDKDSAHISFDVESSIKKQAHINGKGWIEPSKGLLAFDFELNELGIRRFQPYFGKLATFDLIQGWVSAAGAFTVENFNAEDPKLSFNGDVDLRRVALANRNGDELVSWNSLRLNRMVFESAKAIRFSVGEVVADTPHATVVIEPNGRLNLASLISRGDSLPNPKLPSENSRQNDHGGGSIIIGKIRVSDGIMDFADLTLNPSFSTSINDLQGSIKNLSSREAARSDVLLEGKINRSAPAKIFGKVNPFSFEAFTDITMTFDDVDLTTLSPYSTKFAGYRIDKGKLSMDLRYRMRDGRLIGSNSLILDQLALGEKVESPSATTLPVRLAIALLKDSNGRITLELPVEGSLSDPKFSIRDVLRKTTTSLITSLVGSPFSILQGVIGAFSQETEQFLSIPFPAGKSTLGDDQRGKLSAVAQGLVTHPSLFVEIKGSANLASDSGVIAEQELTSQLKNAKLIESRIAGESIIESEDVVLTDEDQIRLLVGFLRSRGSKHPAFAKSEPIPPATLAIERRLMLDSWPVSETQLRRLAQARAEETRHFLIGLGIQEKRIYLRDVELLNEKGAPVGATINLTGS